MQCLVLHRCVKVFLHVVYLAKQFPFAPQNHKDIRYALLGKLFRVQKEQRQMKQLLIVMLKKPSESRFIAFSYLFHPYFYVRIHPLLSIFYMN